MAIFALLTSSFSECVLSVGFIFYFAFPLGDTGKLCSVILMLRFCTVVIWYTQIENKKKKKKKTTKKHADGKHTREMFQLHCGCLTTRRNPPTLCLPVIYPFSIPFFGYIEGRRTGYRRVTIETKSENINQNCGISSVFPINPINTKLLAISVYCNCFP